MKKMKKMKKAIAIILAIVLVGFTGFKVKQKLDAKAQLTQGSSMSRRSSSGTAMVKTLKVVPEPIKETLRMVAEITADTEVAVQPRINGRLLQLMVEEGDRVKAGQLLAVLDDEEIQIQLQQNAATIATVKANLIKAESDLIRAQTELDRYRALLDKKFVSQRDYDNVETAYLAAKTTVENYKSQLATAENTYQLTKIQLNHTKVVAPISGIVLSKPVTAGVNVTTGTTLVTLASLDPVKLKFNIDQRDTAKARKGSLVRFSTDVFPEESFTGYIHDASPSYDTKTRTLSLSVLLPNAKGRLLPGMFGTVEIAIGENNRALVVPQEAIVKREGRSGLFVVTQEGVARWQPVTTGLAAEGRIEITSGLTEGDHVVVVGQNRLRDGDPVQLLDNRRSGGPQNQGQKGGSKPTNERGGPR